MGVEISYRRGKCNLYNSQNHDKDCSVNYYLHDTFMREINNYTCMGKLVQLGNYPLVSNLRKEFH